MHVDSELMTWLADHRTGWITRVCLDLMWLGATRTGLALDAALIVALCWWRKRPAVIVGVGVSVVASSVVTLVLKSLIQRARPGAGFAVVNAEGYSMPSTAAAMSAAAMVPLIALVHRRRGVPAAVCVAVLQLGAMFSVMYLGAHWFTDTVAGTVLGAGIGGAVLLALRRRYADARRS